MRDKRQEPGGRRDGTYDHGSSRSWKVECEKQKCVYGAATGKGRGTVAANQSGCYEGMLAELMP